MKDVAVIPEARCIECLTLAMHLELAFHMADMTLYSDFGQSEFVKGWTATGVVVYVPAGYDLSNNPMATALGRGALNPVFVPIQDSPAWPFKSNVWVVMVGERFPLFSKFPFEPGGSTGWTHAPLSK